MLIRATVTIALGLTLTSTYVSAQERTPYGVRTLSPAGAVKPKGTWNLATRAGNFVADIEAGLLMNENG